MKPQTLLRLYPRKWRERYGDEFVALLQQSGPSWRRTLNIGVSALSERCRSASAFILGESGHVLRRRSCPECGHDIGKDEWVYFTLATSIFDGSPVKPCGTCGTLLTLSNGRRVFAACSSALMLVSIATNHIWDLSRSIRISGILVGASLCVAALLANRSTRLEIVPLDYGKAAQ